MSNSKLPKIVQKYGGNNESGWIQNHCETCGWSGKKHYAYEDYQRTNKKHEGMAHACPKVGFES